MQIQCPKCQRQLRVADTAAGKLVRCPGCGGTFQAVDTVEEYVQTKPPPPPARRPVAEDEPPPRRRREEVEDDRPRRRRDEDDYDDRPRSRRKRYEDDYDDDDMGAYESRRQEARRVGRSAGVWLILAGITVLLMAVFNVISNIMLSSQLAAGGPFARPGGPFGNAFEAGRIAGMIGCGLIALVGALFEFMAITCLRQFRGKGIVVTAIVFGFVFGVLFGFGFIVNIVGLAAVLRVFGGTMAAMTVVQTVLGGLACFFNLFAAIKCIIVLNNAAVSRAFRS